MQDTEIIINIDENGKVVSDDCGGSSLEIESFFAKKDRSFGSSLKLDRGAIQERKILMWDQVPECVPEKCLLLRQRKCIGRNKNESHCTRIIPLVLPIMITFYDEFFELSSDTDFMHIGTIMIPKYIDKFSIHLGIGEWGEKDRTERIKLVMSIDAQIMAMKRDFDKKLKSASPTSK